MTKSHKYRNIALWLSIPLIIISLTFFVPILIMYGTGAIIAGIGIALNYDSSIGFLVITAAVFLPTIVFSTIGLIRTSKTFVQVLLSLLIVVSFFPLIVLTLSPLEQMWILPARGVFAGLYLIMIGEVKDRKGFEAHNRH